MAVTHNESSKTFRLTAATDEITIPLWVKTWRWVGATDAGHTMQLVDPSATTEIIVQANASTADHTEESLVETLWKNGARLQALGSGEVYINYK